MGTSSCDCDSPLTTEAATAFCFNISARSAEDVASAAGANSRFRTTPAQSNFHSSSASEAGGSDPSQCFLLVEAAQVSARSIPAWRHKYFHLAMRRGRKIAKVAMARRLAVQLFWMWRKGWDDEQVRKFGSHAGQHGNRDGVQSNTE